MRLVRRSRAGRKDKGDVFIELFPQKKGIGISIDLTSSQKELFSKAIMKSIKGVLKDYDIKDARLIVIDDGALDFVIKARTEAAILGSIRGGVKK